MKQKLATYCAQCVSRCGCLASVENGVLKRIDKLPNHPTGQGLCVKGRAAPEIVYHKARLLTPLKRTNPKGASEPGWQAIGWDEALATIANRLTQFKSEYGAESVCWGITTPSATAIVDSFAWIHRLAHAFGSPNKLFATENCNWHKDFSHGYTHGQGIGMPEFDKSDLILLWGVNPEVTWPAQAELIKQAQKRGAQLVVIDPRKAGLARKADLWLAVKPGTDGVLALALANHLITSGCYDKAFMGQYSNGPMLVKKDGQFLTQADLEPLDKVNGHCLIALSRAYSEPVLYDPKLKRYQNDEVLLLEGEFELGGSLCRTAFSHYRQACEQYSLTKAQQITGVPAKQIEALAQLMAHTIENKGAISYFSWTGVAQQSQATQITRAMVILYGLTGALDKPGGNLYFTKPKVANLMGFELLSKGQKEKTLGEAHSLGPGQKGWVNSTQLYQSCVLKKPYKTRALIAFGGNPIATKPNEAMIRQTLETLEFYVHADLFINESARYADIVLPVATSWERSAFRLDFRSASWPSPGCSCVNL